MCQKSDLFFATLEYNYRSGMDSAESVTNAIESLAAVYEWKLFGEAGDEEPDEEEPENEVIAGDLANEDAGKSADFAGIGISVVVIILLVAFFAFIWSILGDMEADRKKMSIERLRKTQRMLVEIKCDECGGDGIVEYDGSNPLLPQGRYQCPMCGGLGKLNEYQDIDAGPMESE